MARKALLLTLGRSSQYRCACNFCFAWSVLVEGHLKDSIQQESLENLCNKYLRVWMWCIKGIAITENVNRIHKF